MLCDVNFGARHLPKLAWRPFTSFESMNPTGLKHLITVDPEIVSGTPVFRGTREPIKNLFDYL